MNELNLALFIATGTILVLGVFSGYIKNRLWLSEPLICLLVGIIISPLVLDPISLDLGKDNELMLMHEVARVTLAMSVMGAALRLPAAYEITHLREIGVILGAGMLLMWLLSSAVVYWLFSLPLLTALLIGAIVTPTGPVLSDAIVTGSCCYR